MKPEQYLEAITRPLIPSTQKMDIKRTVDEMGTLLTLTVDNAGVSRVIGKAGVTAQAIRTLINAYSASIGDKVNVKINQRNY